MITYDVSDWSGLFVAAAGASAALAGLVFVVGAISVLAESGGGLNRTVAGILFALAAGVANAWALLVEILR